MPDHKIPRIVTVSAALVLFSLGLALAGYDDGFTAAGKIESSHFAIYYAPQVEAGQLAQELNIGSSDRFLAGSGSGVMGLGGTVDVLFRLVCDMLDMQLYSFRGNIKICQSDAQLDQAYRSLFGRTLAGKKSFYVFELNTIYISVDGFRREILGHEIAHAVMCHYFVVPPSVKIQEVLAMYVEYQLRKR